MKGTILRKTCLKLQRNCVPNWKLQCLTAPTIVKVTHRQEIGHLIGIVILSTGTVVLAQCLIWMHCQWLFESDRCKSHTKVQAFLLSLVGCSMAQFFFEGRLNSLSDLPRWVQTRLD